MSYATLDALIEQYRPAIAAAQASAPTQGLWSHTTPPPLDTATAPDRLDVKPTDTVLGWSDLLPVGIPADWRFAMCIDLYGEQGGYIIRAAVMDNGVRMERAIDEGPEGRSHNWRAVEP